MGQRDAGSGPQHSCAFVRLTTPRSDGTLRPISLLCDQLTGLIVSAAATIVNVQNQKNHRCAAACRMIYCHRGTHCPQKGE